MRLSGGAPQVDALEELAAGAGVEALAEGFDAPRAVCGLIGSSTESDDIAQLERAIRWGLEVHNRLRLLLRGVVDGGELVGIGDGRSPRVVAEKAEAPAGGIGLGGVAGFAAPGPGRVAQQHIEVRGVALAELTRPVLMVA